MSFRKVILGNKKKLILIYKSVKDRSMKRLTLISLILSMILTSCKEYGEVRIMPEFNNNGTEVELIQK